jgi:nucleobase:cation symporter-1, NCS1 family
VPALYDPSGRYSFWHGVNWRALLAFLIVVVPNLPGLADSIKSSSGNSHEPGLNISQGIKNLYIFDWLFGFVVSVAEYTVASRFFTAKESLVETTIYGCDIVEAAATFDIEGSIKQGENEKTVDKKLSMPASNA